MIQGVPPSPILVAGLLRKVDSELLSLLRTLNPEDWERPTVSPKWNVKDVTAHLLDTALRKLSLVRDGFFGTGPAEGEPLPAFINRLNDAGVRHYRQLSPAVLISLMQTAVEESADFHEALDPFAPAVFGVTWAGEEQSLNWFDTARELTERWHHQEQIRLAVGRPGILNRELYHPVLDCFFRALPHSYRDIAADEGTALRFEVVGPCGGNWLLRRAAYLWELVTFLEQEPQAHVRIPEAIAWRIFTKGVSQSEAGTYVEVRGRAELASNLFKTVAIVA
ncbi:MAG TPA: maleylpyruvate isomerase N-terminal domain-containing protein [Bryobacteraceae bacterium]|jgi:uncharacterized protein (TIGR03083 family)|nr:maleylpyruvate isomerase N-terminal domain-containing protein [Bryobacteraceae bacterium]